MNRSNRNAFDRIKTAGTDYQNAVKEALFRFRQADAEAHEESKQYKDEARIYEAKRAAAVANARNAITLAENAMTGTISAEIDGLRDEAFQHIASRPNAAFLDCLKVYNDFGIQPSKFEVEGLLKQNGGNTLGIRAINRLLEKTDSKFRVEAPDGATFEKDLAALERLSRGGSMYSPIDYHTEMVEVFGGSPRLMHRDDGSTYDGGYKWDSVSLITARVGFEKSLADLDGMSERWSKAVLPSAAQVLEYKPQTDKEGKTVTAAEQYIADYEATVDGATVQRAIR